MKPGKSACRAQVLERKQKVGGENSNWLLTINKYILLDTCLLPYIDEMVNEIAKL